MSAFTGPAAQDGASRRLRHAAALVSVFTGIVIFAGKLIAWRLTGSSAVLSDALESIVNVVAALFAVAAIRFADQPADEDHPYGHGKMELLSAAFEGGLIAFAAVLILYQGVQTLIAGPELRSLDLGLLVTVAAGGANLLLGYFLVRTGRRVGSPTLLADGQHVLSDVWTTVGVLVGLLAVRLTGLSWLDPVAALFVGAFLAFTGVKLVKRAADGLLDRDDPELLKKLVDAFNEAAVPGMLSLHRMRVLKHGHLIHIDAHAFVPSDFSVRDAHDAVNQLETVLGQKTGFGVELAFHLDPSPTVARLIPGAAPPPLTVDVAVSRPEVGRHPR